MEFNLAELATSGIGQFAPVAPGVYRLGVLFVNVYAVETDGGWVLVDTGPPNLAPWVHRAAEMRFGQETRPLAIILTHGHFDHAGNAGALANLWDVPIYAHPLEVPYLTGISDYAPPDPTPGGAMCMFSRFFPHRGQDFSPRVQALPDAPAIPALPGWQWLHTPGHTVGHISLFRRSDGVLLAGDAFATADLDSWASHLTRERQISLPPVPFTPDWAAARASVEKLSDLGPQVVAAGHGLPLAGRMLSGELQDLARKMESPPEGRYAEQAATYAENGTLINVPPPAADPLPRQLAIGGAIALTALVSVAAARRLRDSQGDEDAGDDDC